MRLPKKDQNLLVEAYSETSALNRGQKAAASLGRQFIRLSEYVEKFKTMEEFKNNLKNYYIFIDERAAGLDTSMLSGIPDPNNLSPERKNLNVPWVSVMTTSEDAAGMLFLDDLNQASKSTHNDLFGLVNFNERTIAGKYKILGNWDVVK